MTDNFWTLAASGRHTTVIKKSQFEAVAARVDSPERAQEKIQQLSDPQATHNCWAYRVGSLYRFSDDGEPGGSAGRPILAAIDRHGLDHILVLVARHYGGIKLGTGGLARAYGGVAAECLRRVRRVKIRPVVKLTLKYPFDFSSPLHQLLTQCEAVKVQEEFDSEGVQLTLALEKNRIDSFLARVHNVTRGRAKVVALREKERP